MRILASILASIGSARAGLPAGLDYYGQYATAGNEAELIAKEDAIDRAWSTHSQSGGTGGAAPSAHASYGTYECDGFYQSPINIPKKAILKKYKNNRHVVEDIVKDDQKVSLIYKSTDMVGIQRKYTNHTTSGDPVYQDHVDIPTEYQPLNNITIGGSVYTARQLHWHYSSEHEIDGNRFPAELHIVHAQTVVGDASHKPYLVLGFFLKEDATGAASNLFNNGLFASDGSGAARRIGLPTTTYNLGTIFNDQMAGPYYRYQGGLTTPPCSEKVEWFVFETPYKIPTTAQFTDSTANGGHGYSGKRDMRSTDMEVPADKRSNRPIVAIHGRDVQRNTLLAVTNPSITTSFNYRRPATMWSATNPTGSSCTNSGDAARQSPINFVGSAAYRGEVPVNTNWLKQNTVGYVDANTASKSRWLLKNTGHGFNVIPAFTEGSAQNPLPDSYFVKMTSADGTHTYYYKLLQFHVHFPAEHLVDGYQYPGEMHMVHMYDSAYHTKIANKIAAEDAAKNPASRRLEGVTMNPTEKSAFNIDEHKRMLLDEETGERSFVIDGDLLGARRLSGGGAAGIDAVVFGFFLEQTATAESDANNLLYHFGFRTVDGLPTAKDETRGVDVDTKKLMSILFGSDHWKTSVTDKAGDTNWDGRAELNYFKYYGGLTTPSCTEGVQFHIFTKPLAVHAEQIRMFKQHYYANNRPVQTTGNRKVLHNDMHNPNLSTLTMSATNPFAVTRLLEEVSAAEEVILP